MWQHFSNLLSASVDRLYGWAGTSTLQILIFTIGLPTIGFIVTVVWNWYVGGRKVPLKRAFQEALLFPVIVTIALEVFACGMLLAAAVVMTVYDDHIKLVETARKLAGERDALKGLVKEQHCWMQNIKIPPNLSVGAVSSNETVIFCSNKVVAPFMLAVEFDKPPISVAPVAFPEGRIISMDQSLEKSVLFAEIRSPSIPPYQIFLVTAHGGAKVPPQAVKIKITPVDPDK
ncbi:MAG: hypothetical protein Q8S00_12880 [Deltaproteobacteria bacterium]|nr:hypothetical protein [Deltaproteobacteria bacterium]